MKAGKFEATTDESRMKEMDAVSIAVPTPFGQDPRSRHGVRSRGGGRDCRNCRPGIVVVLESTTYPGTTERVMQPKLEAAGLTVGEDLFSPSAPNA